MRLEQSGFDDPHPLGWISRWMLSVGVAGTVASVVALASVSDGGLGSRPEGASSAGQMRLASLTEADEAALSASEEAALAEAIESFHDRFNSSFGERTSSFNQRYATRTELERGTAPGSAQRLRGSPAEAGGDSASRPDTAKRQNARQAMLAPAPGGAPAGVANNKVTLPEDKQGDSILATLGGATAIYDISARTVYLPSGETLEAHSGLGEHMDDLRSVGMKMKGVTPPNVYTLTMRERLFHGVRAVRLNPVDPDRMFGRNGILAHSYLLGPNGDSNGCVSIKDYQKFLDAFLNGEIERIVVIDSLSAPPSPKTAVGWLSRVKGFFRAS
jgi:hypothetical protein